MLELLIIWKLETYFSMMNERHFGLDRQSSLQLHIESTIAVLKERLLDRLLISIAKILDLLSDSIKGLMKSS